MLKPAQKMEARLDQGTARDLAKPPAEETVVEKTVVERTAPDSSLPCTGGKKPKGSKLFETGLLFASGLLLLSWTFVLGWLAVELISWMRG